MLARVTVLDLSNKPGKLALGNAKPLVRDLLKGSAGAGKFRPVPTS